MRPEPRLYPPAVLFRAPPVKFGRRVVAKGALEVRRSTCVRVADDGQAARLAFLGLAPRVDVPKKRELDASRRYLLWLWRRAAMGCRGCWEVARIRMGIGSKGASRCETLCCTDFQAALDWWSALRQCHTASSGDALEQLDVPNHEFVDVGQGGRHCGDVIVRWQEEKREEEGETSHGQADNGVIPRLIACCAT